MKVVMMGSHKLADDHQRLGGAGFETSIISGTTTQKHKWEKKAAVIKAYYAGLAALLSGAVLLE